MTINEIWIIEIAFGSASGFFALSAALFFFLEAYKDENQESIRLWFKSKWTAIQNGKFLLLPEKTISWILKIESRFIELPDKAVDSEWLLKAFLFALPIFVFVPCFFLWNVKSAIIVSLLASPIFIIYLLKGKLGPLIANVIDIILEKTIILYMGILLIFTGYAWLLLSVKINIQYSFFVMLSIMPIYWLTLTGPFLILSRYFNKVHFLEESSFVFCLGATISFSTTYLFLFIGHKANPTSPIPQTIQMLVSNVFFDGMTMVATLMILRWAIAHNSVIRIPAALLIDILVAGVLACASLYFGLIFTSNSLSIKQVSLVLIAKAPTHFGFEIGPYFWAMHTTFIPTFIYSFLICFAWVAKIILYPINWFFGIGQTHKNPLKLTGAVFTVFSVLLGGLSYGTGAVGEYLENKDKNLNNKLQQTQKVAPLIWNADTSPTNRN